MLNLASLITDADKNKAAKMIAKTVFSVVYSINAGSTPNDVASASESSWAPNLLEPSSCNFLARTPSRPSSIAARTTSLVDINGCPCIKYTIPMNPAIRFPIVTMSGVLRLVFI